MIQKTSTSSTSSSYVGSSRRRRIVVSLAYYIYLIVILLLSQLVVVIASTNNNNNKIRTIIDRTGKSVFSSSSFNDDDDNVASDRIVTTSDNNFITVVTSPGIPSLLFDQQQDDEEVIIQPPLFLWEDRILVCQGATLSTTSSTSDSDDETTTSMRTSRTMETCLSVCSHISNMIVLEGITTGDLETTNGGILNTRHARTLSYLFQSKLQSPQSDGETIIIPTKQMLLLAITTTSDSDVIDEGKLIKDLRTLFQVVTGGGSKKTFEDLYEIQIARISSSLSGSKILSDVISLWSKNIESSEAKSWSSIIGDAVRMVRDQPTITTFTTTPHMAQIMATISTVSMQLTRTVRAKVATWKSRISRGLLVDGFGKDASAFRKRILTMYDTETLTAAGIATVAPYRYEMRQQLQAFIDTSIQQAFTGQVSNLEKLTVKRFNAALLQTVDNNSKESAESILGRNAATMRKEALLFETVIEDMEVPELGLVKDKPIRDVATKLNNALNAFPDSPAAKLKRLQQVTKVVNKEKQPGQRSINFGLDLVAMLRPDGFGSLQGFAGYQLPGGNSITFGIHNDADDPQVIAQFGGVRPPLLRVQPKLRVDVEM